MAFPRHLSDFRIIFFRSFYPESAAAGTVREKDERLVQVFDLLAKAGMDTAGSLMNPQPTDKSLSSQQALEHLEFVRQLEGFPCALFLWTKQENETEVLSFCGRLMRAYPDPLADSPMVWFRENPVESYYPFSNSQGGISHLLALPYKLAYGEIEVERLRNFLLFRRPPSRMFKAVQPNNRPTEPPSDDTQKITVVIKQS